MFGHRGLSTFSRRALDVLADCVTDAAAAARLATRVATAGNGRVLGGGRWLALDVVPLLLAMNVGRVARSRRSITLEEWANKYLGDELFMYVGAAVGATWLVLYMSGRWRKPADWIDVMGRIVGVMWIVIGLIWTLHEYMEFV